MRNRIYKFACEDTIIRESFKNNETEYQNRWHKCSEEVFARQNGSKIKIKDIEICFDKL
jgi:hypothetical protein